MEEKISIPTDSEGYYSLECPYCKEVFKASGNDVDGEETWELFCPFCGLVEDSNSFIPDEVIEHAKTLALNYMKQQLNKTFKKTSRSMKGSSVIFDYKKLNEENPMKLTEDERLEQVELLCCNRTIKVHADQTRETIYCPFCGVN